MDSEREQIAEKSILVIARDDRLVFVIAHKALERIILREQPRLGNGFSRPRVNVTGAAIRWRCGRKLFRLLEIGDTQITVILTAALAERQPGAGRAEHDQAGAQDSADIRTRRFYSVEIRIVSQFQISLPLFQPNRRSGRDQQQHAFPPAADFAVVHIDTDNRIGTKLRGLLGEFFQTGLLGFP